jgi:multidrug efflux pump subunit AcrA (membrane-fusion protein)
MNLGTKEQPMAFKLSKAQLVERDALAADLRAKAEALNIAIVAFNQTVEPLAQKVGEALDAYNEILERARTLTDRIAETAQAAFDAKSEKWQDSDKGIQMRNWIEQWEMSLDNVDLELPGSLTEIDPDRQAGEIEDAPPNPPQ